ncbi:protein jag [Streptococcus sp. HF-1907]|uniref:RNA-binding cell elongation regulator Jag/EloR n=1 Tax=Streptococcus sp. HF-1907 TaxID=2785793 RepID=UPI00189F84BA|nr:RNA-binding cell elongation regulator Jag/EloR [Streptococcus sp. HF-1907]MBF7094655.1 protein jag [Streptococcus sp. HF-1907]
MVLFTGSTVEEAIEKGLSELNLSRLKAHIKVVSREKKGFLGFGKRPAEVDIEGIDELTIHKADQKAVRGVPEEVVQQAQPVSSPKEDAITTNKVTSILKKKEEVGEQVSKDVKEAILENKKSEETILKEANQAELLEELERARGVVPEPQLVEPADQPAVEETSTPEKEDSFESFVINEFGPQELSTDIKQAAQEVTDYVQKIIYEMDIEASIETSNNRRQINLQIETPEAGRVIGYHGKVLKSMQLLAQNFLHDRYSKNFSVSLNVHDYVEHRTETLIDFTQKIAARVLESGQDYIMDPMSNSERKTVHKTVAAIAGVDSYSEGNDPNRYVVVTLKGNEA